MTASLTRQKEALRNGKVLPVMEEFYSLQGEGFNTGLPAWFLRIGGCDVGCKWCDIKESWNAKAFPPVDTDDVISRILDCPAKSVVVTGGEPMLYNLDYLCEKLRKSGIRLFLETSGSQPISGQWDWVCLSPKKDSPPLDSNYVLANELKIIIFDESDFVWAENQAKRTNGDCRLYLQPEWSRSPVMIPLIVEYILKNPSWRISLQSHKYMHIP